jgi:CRISPR-associated protein Cas1
MKLDESNIARWYWEYFFSNLGHKQNREKQNAESFENKALNYGYAVIASLIHRSILIHGLLPDLGVQHKFRYRSTPLVYDLIEPYRPFIDYMLYIWSKISLEYKKTDEQIQWRAWINYLMNSLKNCRIKKPFEKHSHKLIDTIDISVASIASVFRDYKLENIKQLIWLPEFKDHYWHNQDEEQI